MPPATPAFVGWVRYVGPCYVSRWHAAADGPDPLAAWAALARATPADPTAERVVLPFALTPAGKIGGSSHA